MQDIFLFLEQHWILSSGLLGVLILLILIEFLKQNRGAGRLSTSETIQYINHKNATVVDLRNAENYAAGHIVDAISLPLSDLESKQKKIEKYKSKPIILVCAAGIESKKAWSALHGKGFMVYVLDNGMNGWKDAGLPTVKS